jgi:hypothetical protein
MKYSQLIPYTVLLCILLPALSAGQAPELRRELQIYPYYTQIGTVARSTFHDRQGRLQKEVFYTLKDGLIVLPPYTEDMLKVQSIRLYQYNEQGQQIRQEHYNAKMKLQDVWQIIYGDGNHRKMIKYTPEGIRQYEIRFAGNTSTSHLYYDEEGKRLWGIRGEIPTDIDLDSGWGEPKDGLACGIVLAQAKSQTDGTLGYHIYTNIKNVTSQSIFPEGFSDAKIEIRDSSGHLIKEKAEYRKNRYDPLQKHRAAYGLVLLPGYAEVVYPAYELNTRYANLPPGHYSIRLKQSIKKPKGRLISNPVLLEVK